MLCDELYQSEFRSVQTWHVKFVSSVELCVPGSALSGDFLPDPEAALFATCRARSHSFPVRLLTMRAFGDSGSEICKYLCL
jgi:hypothetical protein